MLSYSDRQWLKKGTNSCQQGSNLAFPFPRYFFPALHFPASECGASSEWVKMWQIVPCLALMHLWFSLPKPVHYRGSYHQLECSSENASERGFLLNPKQNKDWRLWKKCWLIRTTDHVGHKQNNPLPFNLVQEEAATKRQLLSFFLNLLLLLLSIL